MINENVVLNFIGHTLGPLEILWRRENSEVKLRFRSLLKERKYRTFFLVAWGSRVKGRSLMMANGRRESF